MVVLLYGRYVATVPLFQGLSKEVLSALCCKCVPMTVIKNQTVIQEGEPGQEMYMLISGECEVSEQRGKETMRLGFLCEGTYAVHATTSFLLSPSQMLHLNILLHLNICEGAFFGETPVLAAAEEPGIREFRLS